jgi:hydrogenase maturation protein HypF
MMPGGDAAARYPVQAAAGFLSQIDGGPDLSAWPFDFPRRYQTAVQLVRRQVRTFSTTSVGRLFDAAAALLGFTSEITFEGQAAMWLEYLARKGKCTRAYAFPFVNHELDFRPLLASLMKDRAQGKDVCDMARGFQLAIANGMAQCATQLSRQFETNTIVLSGGVFQNELLLEDFRSAVDTAPLDILTNHEVPPNDGGISLGQAALAVFARAESRGH